MKKGLKVTGGSVSVSTVPTNAPEAVGTCSWSSTSTVLVRIQCGDVRGPDYTFADKDTAGVADKLLKTMVPDSDPMRSAETWQRMLREIRNLGETGIAMIAVSAIDNALGDSCVRLMNVSLVSLLGQARTGIPAYGSGGFTTYSDRQLQVTVSNYRKRIRRGSASNGDLSAQTDKQRRREGAENGETGIGRCCREADRVGRGHDLRISR